MTGRPTSEMDEERVIRDWLTESAPRRFPDSLRQTLESVTTRPAGSSRRDARSLSSPARLGLAAAALIVAASSVFVFGRWQAGRPAAPASPSSTVAPATPHSGWTAVTGALPALDGSYRPGGRPIYARLGGGFLAFIPTPIGGTEIFSSLDGAGWTAEGRLDGYVISLASGDGVAMAVGCSNQDGHQVPASWTTPDQRTWQKALVPGTTGDSGCLMGVAAGDKGFLAWTYSVSGGGQAAPPVLSRLIWRSDPGGAVWHPVAATGLPEDASIDDMSSSADGFVIRGSTQDRAAMWFSPDGGSWTQVWTGPLPVGDEVFMLGPVFGDSTRGYVSLGGRRIITNQKDLLTDRLTWTSPDGLHWTLAARTPAPGWITAVAKGPDGYVAVGSTQRKEQDPVETRLGAPAVWTSTDGQTWRPVGLPATGITTAGHYWVAGDGAHIVVLAEDTDRGTVLIVE